MPGTLPEPFQGWFIAQGWTPRPHQLAMLDAAQAGESVLLIAPTGGGKTLAGFLPSLVDLAGAPRQGLHTLYVSPLKALATDIARNLTRPVQDMRLPITIEARHGDTPANRRARQRETPAEHPADDTGKPGRAAVDARCAGAVRLVALHRDGRGARDGRHQAWRPTGPRCHAPAEARAEDPVHRPVRHRCASGCDPGLHRRHKPHRDRRRRAARIINDPAGRPAVLVRPYGAGGGAAGHGADPRRRHDDRLCQHPRPGGTGLPGAVEAE